MLQLVCALCGTEMTMKTQLACVLLFIQFFEACAEVVFEHLKEGQSLALSVVPRHDQNHLTGLHLYHRGAQGQTTLLSLAEGEEARMDSGSRARLQLRGELTAPEINVSISHLQLSDAGLYMWELSYGQENSSGQTLLSGRRVYLWVEGTGQQHFSVELMRLAEPLLRLDVYPCVFGAGRSHQCSGGYVPLLLTIFSAAVLLLVTLTWMVIDKCVRRRHTPHPHPHPPIYEEMDRKQRTPESPQNSCRASSHLEEVDFPVYANPNIRQPQDNYYACPRQLAHKSGTTTGISSAAMTTPE
ncbi:unnamed protein product [Menidia menidia]|uniref:(Atlantic silverside) hypothetical protein n=1 Tax=Menidia menidia TaxID=238744 RepID=A0A8S4ATE7_9TELE|nr:unnamed protein product [Menidia menidia]